MTPSIEQVLADFRGWLEEAGPAAVPPAPASPPVDVATVLGHFVALRQEVNLQTRAVRAQQEQNAELLARLARDERGPPRDQLLALVEAHDALSLAAGPVARARQSMLAMLAPPAPAAASARSFWSRWFGGPAAPPPADDAGEQLRRALDGLVSGYEMSLQRLERAMTKVGLEPVPAVGRPFDPELMEAMDAVAGTGRPAGEVVEEVRRGYRLQGRPFRVAQVRVARD